MNELEARNARSWKDFAALINGAWRKGVVAFIETGRLLLEAKNELDREVFESLVKQRLDFDTSTGRKLMAVAGNHLICAHGHKLPPCWTTIYELSKLADEPLRVALGDGTIHPGMHRKDATALRKPIADEAEGEQSAPVEPEPHSDLELHWHCATKEERGAFLDAIGVSEILDAMSDAFGRDLRARVPAPKKRKTLTLVANNCAPERGHRFRH